MPSSARWVAVWAVVTALEGTAAAQEPAPKVAVVVVGDPDTELRTAAEQVDAAIAAATTMRVPEDPTLREALRGEPGAVAGEDDGYDRLRRDRRRLGAGEGQDLPVVVGLGRAAGAVVVALVRRRGAAIEVVVVDVERRSFFGGAVAASDEAVVGFVLSRARAAVRAADTATATDTDTDTATATATETATDTATATATVTDSQPPPSGPMEWLSRNWPVLLAVGVVATIVVLFAVTSGPDSPSDPVLRFIPGGR